MKQVNNDIKSLYEDLRDYSRQDLITLAKYHDLPLTSNKMRLAMEVAKANYITTKKANMKSAVDIRQTTLDRVHEANINVLKKAQQGIKEIIDMEDKLFGEFSNKIDIIDNESNLMTEFNISELGKCIDATWQKYNNLQTDLSQVRRPVLKGSPPPGFPSLRPQPKQFPPMPKRPQPQTTPTTPPTEPKQFPPIPKRQIPQPKDTPTPTTEPKQLPPPMPKRPPHIAEKHPFGKEVIRREWVPGVPGVPIPSVPSEPLPSESDSPELVFPSVPSERPGSSDPLFPKEQEQIKCQTDEECQQKANLSLLGKECAGQKVICVTKRDGTKACVYEPVQE